ncbi:uncharacterized protein LOC126637171 isoform X7 [Myiozetetes cayanensis]|uniref:uncharacterized protein LOC126637171 isoform X7 n=3 Tax=Myiozetetes cayanensis TaxID=478635 RepID=UPI00215ED2C8|nr:uncharacterized protein LOC126637171 isoform X7 [Myiozetetes cayanensis]
MEDMVPSHPKGDTPSQDTNPWRTWCHPTPRGTPHPRTQIHGGHDAIPPHLGHPIPGHKSMEDMVPSHPKGDTPSQDTNPWRTWCHPTPPGKPHPRTQIHGGHGAIPPHLGNPIPGHKSMEDTMPSHPTRDAPSQDTNPWRTWCHPTPRGTPHSREFQFPEGQAVPMVPSGHRGRVSPWPQHPCSWECPIPGDTIPWRTHGHGIPDAQWGHPIPGHKSMEDMVPSHPTWETPSQDTNPWRTRCHPTPPGKPHPRTQIHGGHGAIPPHLGNPIPGHKSMEDTVPSHPNGDTPSQGTNPWRTWCHPTPMGTPHPRTQIHGGHDAIPPQGGNPIPGNSSSLKDRPCPWCHQGTGDVSPRGHSTRVPGNVPSLGTRFPGGHTAMAPLMPSGDTPSQDTNPWRTRCHPTPMGTPHPRTQIHGGHDAIPPHQGNPIPGHKSMEDMMPSHPKGDTPSQDTNPWRT